jgi:hypothetical protein
MSTVSTLCRLLALSACLVAQLHGTGSFQMPGMRRAMQTMADAGWTAPVGSVPITFAT